MVNKTPLQTFLFVLTKFNYPNKDDFHTLSRLSGYESDSFIGDLVEELGEEGAYKFINKSFEKLETPGKGIRIDFDSGEYVYLIIEDVYIDLDESDDSVMIDFLWGENMFYDEDGNQTTLDKMDDESDFSDFDNLDDFYDWMKNGAADYIYGKTGINVWWGI